MAASAQAQPSCTVTSVKWQQPGGGIPGKLFLLGELGYAMLPLVPTLVLQHLQ